jgi:hypothetical protein
MGKAVTRFCAECGRQLQHAKPGAERSYCLRCYSRRPPTREEIEAGCAEIQAEWNEQTRRSRMACDITRRQLCGWLVPGARANTSFSEDTE